MPFLPTRTTHTPTEFEIVDGATGKCMDNDNGNNQDYVKMWPCVGDPALARQYGQHWVLRPGLDNAYFIKDVASGRLHYAAVLLRGIH